MQNPFLYPGKGIPLHQAKSQTDPRLNESDGTVLTILNGQYSEPFGAGDALEIMLDLVMNGAATGDVTIHRVGWVTTTAPQTTDAGDVFDTISFNNETRKSYRNGGMTDGHYRLYNGSGTNLISADIQKRIN